MSDEKFTVDIVYNKADSERVEATLPTLGMPVRRAGRIENNWQVPDALYVIAPDGDVDAHVTECIKDASEWDVPVFASAPLTFSAPHAWAITVATPDELVEFLANRCREKEKARDERHARRRWKRLRSVGVGLAWCAFFAAMNCVATGYDARHFAFGMLFTVAAYVLGYDARRRQLW